MRLELKGISKSFPGIKANDRIDLRIGAGKIHAVLGENGAGKSTLMKIIYGVYAPDAGAIFWNGRKVSINSPAQAQRLGIGMVHQHFALFDALTVAENIALGLPGRMNLTLLSQRIAVVSEKYGLPVEPSRHVFTMSVGERQRVEIIRCLLQSPRLLILDEPTSVLTPQAVERLFETLRQLADEGCSVVYISHKLEEVRSLCHGATVLRQGRYVGDVIPAQVSARQLAQLMIGSDMPHVTSRRHTPGSPALVISKLNRDKNSGFSNPLVDISLTVRAGEVVGIAGVSGNGQNELLRAISGETIGQPSESDAAVTLFDKPVNHLGAGARRSLGLGFVPEERLGRGAVPGLTLAENAALTGWRKGLLRWPRLINRQACSRFAKHCIQHFHVRSQGPDTLAQNLSGGNLQKYIVGREIMLAPKVMLLAQPTWGVDVGAAALIRQQIRDLAEQGVALLVVSEELEELFEVCDRIAVIYRGRLSPVVAVADTSTEDIGLWMAGLWEDGVGQKRPGRVTSIGGRIG